MYGRRRYNSAPSLNYVVGGDRKVCRWLEREENRNEYEKTSVNLFSKHSVKVQAELVSDRLYD